MGSLKVYATVAGFLAAAMSITTTRAADFLPPPPPPPLEPSYSEPVGGGWYLRGDVGVSHYEGGKFKSPSVPNATFYGEDYGSGGFAGAGIGYQFNHWFRADVTGEYRFSTGISGNDKERFSVGGVPINGYERFKGSYSSAVFLVNGYFDLGTWWGFTPFVGAGVGYANNFLHGFETTTQNYYPTLNVNNGINGGTFRDKDRGNLAWALHAGLGYDVTPNVKLELAYRYLNLGEVQTGVIDCYCGAVYAGVKAKDFESHDVKLGMRWALGGSSAPAYEPAPLMRKY